MAKIGTAHIEIKPVLNEEALDAIVKRIEDAVEAGVSRAMADANKSVGRVMNEAAQRGRIKVWRDGKAVEHEGTA